MTSWKIASRLWATVYTCLPPALGAALLPQGLQGQVSCKNREGPFAHKKVAWVT